jgi:glucose/arabinose dehydrogenase
MGVAFVPDGALDARFEGNAIVALRGSWGTRPTGSAAGDPASRRPPRLMMVVFREGKAAGVEEVLGGLQRDNGQRLARPVGVAVGPDGALYFTSDSGLQGLFRLGPAPQ